MVSYVVRGDYGLNIACVPKEQFGKDIFHWYKTEEGKKIIEKVQQSVYCCIYLYDTETVVPGRLDWIEDYFKDEITWTLLPTHKFFTVIDCYCHDVNIGRYYRKKYNTGNGVNIGKMYPDDQHHMFFYFCEDTWRYDDEQEDSDWEDCLQEEIDEYCKTCKCCN